MYLYETTHLTTELKLLMMAKSLTNNLNTTQINLESLFNESPDMYVSVSPVNAHVLFCNQTLLNKLHYTLEEVINKPVFQLYHPDFLEKANQAFNEFVRTGQVKNKEMALITKEGEKIDVSLNVNAIKDEKGKILYSISSWRDINGMIETRDILDIKKKELECLRRLNKLQSYRNLSDKDFLKQTVIAISESWLNPSKDGVIINYLNTTYELGNTEKASHYLSEEIIIKDIKLGKISFCLNVKDKSILKHHETLIGDIRNIITDTLTSKNTDELMLLLESAVKSSNDCIAIATAEGKHIYQNDGFKKMLGYSFEEMKHKKPSSIYAIQEIGIELFKTIMRGESWKGEAELIHKNGKSIPMLIRADAIKNKNDEIIGLIGIHSDITEKLERERKEKQRQKQALKIFNAIDEMVYVADPKTYKLLFTNQNLNKSLGKGNKLEGELCYKVLQGKDKPCDFCNNDILFNKNNEEPIIWEFQNELNNRWYRLTDKKIKWFNGKQVRLEIASDITEVTKTNIRLAESEERYQLATSASDNGIWDWWVHENKVFYSDKWKAQLGYEPHELEDTFENWQKNLHPEDHDRMVQAVQDFIQKPGDYFIQEFRLKHKDGSYRWIRNRASAVLDEKGQVIRMFGAHTDITERKIIKETLHKTDQLYRNLIQNAPDGIALIDYEGNYKFMSPSGLNLFGFTHKEIKSLNTNILTHPDDLENKLNTIQAIIGSDTKYSPTIEYRLQNKDHEYIWIESTFSKITDQEDQPAIVINFRNVTERKDYEKRLIKARKKAETANIHKNQFLANMSHEIRTPMNGVVGFADLLKDDDLDHESKKKFLNIIDKNAKQLLTLIDDIIDIAKIEAEELKIIKSHFFLNEILYELKNVFDNLKASKGKNELEIKLTIPENTDLLQIYTDQARLRQILTNLIGNAIKFTEEGHINFGYHIDKNKIKFFVEDTGRGIPKEKVKSIFERFQQVNLEDSTKFGGTGLGLTISKGLIEVLGGKIIVSSEFNVGTRFDFHIPIGIKKLKPEITEANSKNSTENKLQNKTILLAEDDENIQFYYQSIFEKQNTNLIIASDGRKAVEIYKNNPKIDLILMDIRMPEMNGYTATRKILSINPKAIIIAQTAYVMPEEKTNCIAAGCKDYLTKPITKKELFSKLNQYL